TGCACRRSRRAPRPSTTSTSTAPAPSSPAWTDPPAYTGVPTMSSTAIAQPAPVALAPPRRRASVLLTLARRRAMLTSRTPRQIAVPLLGPALLALILAPALQKATGGLHSHIDYTSFVRTGAVGLVIPLTCVFAGLSVLVDRHSAARRCVPHQRRRRGLVPRRRRAVHRVHVRTGRNGGQPRDQGGGLRGCHAGAGHPAVLLRRSAVPHRRDADGPGRHRQGPAADARARPAALWVHRPLGPGAARHLGDEQRRHRSVAEPRRGRGVRRGSHLHLHPRVLPIGGELMERRAGGTDHRPDRAQEAAGSAAGVNSRGSAVVMPCTPSPRSDWMAARSLTVQAYRRPSRSTTCSSSVASTSRCWAISASQRRVARPLRTWA